MMVFEQPHYGTVDAVGRSTPTIEMVFSKLKAILRAAAERTLDGLWEAAANALDCFKPKECQNYFTAAGYNPI